VFIRTTTMISSTRYAGIGRVHRMASIRVSPTSPIWCATSMPSGPRPYDRAYGTTHAEAINETFRNGVVNEFQLADGELQPILSDCTGVTLIFKPTLVSAATNVTLLNTSIRFSRNGSG
jgi:hypothetical protein